MLPWNFSFIGSLFILFLAYGRTKEGASSVAQFVCLSVCLSVPCPYFIAHYVGLGALKMREWKMQEYRKYRSDNERKAVITENCKILGVSTRTKRSQMVFER